MKPAKQPATIVLIGPSGSGKSTVARALLELGTVTVIPPPAARALADIEARFVSRLRRASLIIARAAAVPSLAEALPNICVYQLTVPVEVARDRLIEQGCSPEELETRLAAHEDEVRAGAELANRVFVNDGRTARLVRAMQTAICEDLGLVDQLAPMRPGRRQRRLRRVARFAWLTCLVLPPLWPVAVLWAWAMFSALGNK